MSGVQLDGGQHSLTAWGGGDSGGSGVGEGSSNGGSGVVEGETGGVVQGKTSGVGVGEASDGRSSNHSRGGLISGPLAVSEGKGVGIGDNRGGSDFVGDRSGGDHIRLDDGSVGNSADRSKGGDGGGKSSGVGETSIGVSTIEKDLGIGFSLLPLSGGGGGSIESSLELSLGGGHLSSVLNRGWALEVEHWGDKGSDLGGNRGGGSHGEVGGSDSVAVHGVGHIVDSLEEAVGVNILVTAGRHAIRVPRLGLG